jgi:hypothetical protein
LELGAIQIDLGVNKTETIKKNAETLIDATIEVGLGANAEKTKYMLIPQHHNAE